MDTHDTGTKLFYAKSRMLTYYLVGRGWKVLGARDGADGFTEYCFDLEAQRELREYTIARSTLYAHEAEMKRQEAGR